MSEGTEHNRDDDVALAGEYALGLLTPDDAMAFEQRLNREPELRALYAEWCESFATLSEQVDAVQPRPITRARLAQEVFQPRESWKDRLRELLWLIGGAVVASLIVFAVFVNNPAQPTHAAELIAEDQSLAVAALWVPDDNALTVTRSRGAPADGRDWELWLIVGEAAPVSLGVLPRDSEGVIEIGAEHAALIPNAILAISDEPLGGSPTGQATGPVLAVGEVQDI